jgi:hypothetical protein
MSTYPEARAEYTPTTQEIREYVEVGGEPRPWEEITAQSEAKDAARAAAFDRWLVAHDAEVIAGYSKPREADTDTAALIASARTAAGALEEYEFEGVAGDAAGLLNRLADEAACYSKHRAADGREVPDGHVAILIQQARALAEDYRRYDDTQDLVDVLVMMANALAALGAVRPAPEPEPALPYVVRNGAGRLRARFESEKHAEQFARTLAGGCVVAPEPTEGETR